MALHRCRAPYHRHSTRLAKAGLPIRPPQAKETSRTTVRSRTWPPIQIPRTVDMSCPTTAMRAIHNSPKMGTVKALMETKAIRQLSMHKTPMEAKESPISPPESPNFFGRNRPKSQPTPRKRVIEIPKKAGKNLTSCKLIVVVVIIFIRQRINGLDHNKPALALHRWLRKNSPQWGFSKQCAQY